MSLSSQSHLSGCCLVSKPLQRTLASQSARRTVGAIALPFFKQQKPLRDVKAEVLKAVANTQRGQRATPAQRKEILALIESLEARNPTKSPAKSDLLSGRWSLLFTGPTEESEFRKTRAGTLEGPFLSRLKPLSANAFRTKGITQVLDPCAGKAENLAEFSIANAINGSLNILGAVTPSQDTAFQGTRVNVEFTAFDLKLGPLQTTIPLGWIKPKGWIQTTFLDSELRVGRGDKGSIFLAARQKIKK
ncbi:hypothetical protein WJX84_010153 [Apatococcus fuscideae]|uniref:Plastid lipid-associated protein/fibrillin conserved domain-containing protein n=1 Tax=Apatococcus fuscideae TaxID=2026836 RepID=A0AAW1SRJ3_9CHLO